MSTNIYVMRRLRGKCNPRIKTRDYKEFSASCPTPKLLFPTNTKSAQNNVACNIDSLNQIESEMENEVAFYSRSPLF
jgi:hypothetical protein